MPTDSSPKPDFPNIPLPSSPPETMSEIRRLKSQNADILLLLESLKEDIRGIQGKASPPPAQTPTPTSYIFPQPHPHPHPTPSSHPHPHPLCLHPRPQNPYLPIPSPRGESYYPHPMYMMSPHPLTQSMSPGPAPQPPSFEPITRNPSSSKILVGFFCYGYNFLPRPTGWPITAFVTTYLTNL